jgi:uncharacterized protein DUF5919
VPILQVAGGPHGRVSLIFSSGTFYAQTQPKVAQMLAGAAARGARVRLYFGDPVSEAVAVRDREEGLGRTPVAKIRSALTYYRETSAVAWRLPTEACR